MIDNSENLLCPEKGKRLQQNLEKVEEEKFIISSLVFVFGKQEKIVESSPFGTSQVPRRCPPMFFALSVTSEPPPQAP